MFAKIKKIGDVVIYRPNNCPYKAVAQAFAIKYAYGSYTDFYFAYFDYLLENEKGFCVKTMQTKNIPFLGSQPSGSVNIGNFSLHHKISLEEFEQRIKKFQRNVCPIISCERTSDTSIYFGYRAGQLDRALLETYRVHPDKDLPSLILNNPLALYGKNNIGYDGTRFSPYSKCTLFFYPSFSSLKFEVGDLFKIPLSNGDFCVGQLLYYNPETVGPVIAIFLAKKAVTEKLIAIAAIIPSHFYWKLWEIYDNRPPVIDYDFASEANKNWKGWYCHSSGHIQQFVEACHGLTKWQKGRFEELLFNPELKPPDLEEIEIELDDGFGNYRKPLFKLPKEPPVNSAMLSPGRFWKIIAESKEKAADDSEKQMKILTEILLKADKEEIEKFNNRFYRCFFKAYTWELWGAAFVALGGCSDDAFMDFRGWLIAQGKEVFEAALKDPEGLVDYAPLENSGIMEGFSYCASDAYEELGYGSLEYGIMPVFEPKGREWTEEDLPGLYPRLWEKFS